MNLNLKKTERDFEMSYKNEEVIKEFVNYGLDETIKSKHLYFEQDVLFSYGSHFPLCIRLKDC